MATLSEVKLKDGGQNGPIICTADGGDTAINNSIVKLTTNVAWNVQDPKKFLQKKVVINAKISRPGEPTRSFAKTMFITKMGSGFQNVSLGDAPLA